MTTAGYSGTPLAKKLGIKDHARLFVHGAPGNYLQLLAPLPSGARLVPQPDSTTDIVHIFTKSRAELTAFCRQALPKLRPDAAVWVSWPKKASGVVTDVTEGTIREVTLPLGLVDIKVCAFDATWSGLKLVLRKQHRPRK